MLISGMAGAISGLLFALSLPPFEWSGLAWFLALPLLLVCSSRPGPECLFAAYCCGLVASSQALYGVFAYNTLVAIALLFFCPLWIVLPVSLFVVCRKTWRSRLILLLTPFFWVASEMLFLEVFSLPLDTASVFARDNAAVQLASILGASSLTFMAVLSAALATLGIRSFLNRQYSPGLLWLLAMSMLPAAAQNFGSVPASGGFQSPCAINVQLAQPVIPVSSSSNSWVSPEFRRNIRDTAWRFLKAAPSTKPQIFVWPEGSAGFTNFRIGKEAEPYIDYARDTDKHLFITATDTDETGSRFNSIFAVSPGGSIRKYDKTNLVPLAESNITAGSHSGVEETAIGRVSTAICIEVCFPDYMRRLAGKRPAFLLVSSSDAWFGPSSMAELHLSQSILRAVETRLPVVHAANTGPSAIIDPYGKLVQKSHYMAQTLLQGCVPNAVGQSLFIRFGYLFRYGCALVSLVCLVIAVFQRRNRDVGTVRGGRLVTGSVIIGLLASLLAGAGMALAGALLMSRHVTEDATLTGIMEALQPVPTATVPGRSDIASVGQVNGAALNYIASYYGVDAHIEERISVHQVSDQTTSNAAVADTARSLGFSADITYPELENLLGTIPPVLVETNYPSKHYAVMLGVKRNNILLFDPLQGLGTIMAEQFSQLYGGSAILIRPPVLVPGQSP